MPESAADVAADPALVGLDAGAALGLKGVVEIAVDDGVPCE